MGLSLKLENLALFALALWLFAQLGYSWWSWALLFLAPDVAMLGYLAGPRFGAATYNLAHHKGVAVAAYFAGLWLGAAWLLFAGTLLLGHSTFDRVLGYGLKYPDSFGNTHLAHIPEVRA